jgi:phenylalanyl-tRNA synthetase alpha chain
VTEHVEEVNRIKQAFEQEFGRFADLRLDGVNLADLERIKKDLSEVSVRHTGKKSAIAGAMKLVGRVDADRRAEFGQLVQSTQKFIDSRIEELSSRIDAAIARSRIESERVDVTIPGRRPKPGHAHPITILRQRIEDIFVAMGYAIENDREIETDYYNFDALNIPDGHPARESQDTFYTTEGFALRSQTSTVQIRAMERRGVPIRILAPGKVFRRDTPDMTHVPMFHQVEGLCVDRGITMAHLKGTVTEWLKRLFGADTVTRFRPSYFPFTEPSAEFDFSCFKCRGTGVFDGDRCRPCKGSGWIELGGCGMVHPNVLKSCGVDSKEYSGFAFGFGLERMAAMLYSIDDIRLMYENDVRFLEQFG